jgi:hypothetical protein
LPYTTLVRYLPVWPYPIALVTIGRYFPAARGGRELWLSMVSVVIALGLIELVLVRRWSGEGM